MEEKAKKYDAAIERARKYLTYDDVDCPSEIKDVIRVIFPELKESEDERIVSIIKNIIKGIKRGSTLTIGAKTADDCIAYLERQKKQKPSLIFDIISSWLRDHASNYVNSEFNEFHHCVEYDGTINVERLIADLKVAVDNNTSDVDAKFDAREPRDNWEYIKEFCDKFGRMPKDMDELDALVSYVVDKKQKEQNIVPSRETILGIWELGNLWKENPEERDGLTQLQYIQKYWFEKCDYQKEQKPVECIEFDNEFKNQVSHLLASVLNKEWEYNKGFIEYAAQQLLGYAKREFISQSGVEWSEEDKEMFKITLDNLEEIELKYGENYGRVGKCMDWIESLPDRFNLQPKQEWSKEDKETIEKTICILETNFKPNEGFTGLDINRSQLVDRLNSLRPQPKQEWNEEDEQMRQTAIEACKTVAEDYENSNARFYKCKDWLEYRIKSLRPHPHWRPSEEQIRAVFDASERNDKLGSVLTTLYRDLKNYFKI